MDNNGELNNRTFSKKNGDDDYDNNYNENDIETRNNDKLQSFLLIDENELIQINSAEELAQRLGAQTTPQTLVKVVSIFGTIGHGKSYTLNNTFFDCQKVFKTSSSQESCTIGIWAAFDQKRRVITLDTEGLLGVSANCQRRTRLLLKVMAISDIVIYRTKSERLEDNLFTFLGDASRVYAKHFSNELQNAFQRLPELDGHPMSELGPVVIIFQETRDTEPLKEEEDRSKESIIRGRFKTLGLTTEAFSAIEYVGIQTIVRPTNFDLLKQCIKRHIKSSSARTSRPISIIYATLKLLNEKFSGDVEQTVPSMFNNNLLTCPVKCLSCNARCINSMNHHRDGLGHRCETKCVFQHQFNNHLLYCRACHERGEQVIVTPRTCSSDESPWLGLAKYAWSGYVLECSRCGVINRSRQYWFGNKETWEMSVRTEINHVWPGELNKMQAAQNAAQRVLDSVSYLTETVSSIGAKPTKIVSEWVADQIAPNYWIPNSRILHCALCNAEFGEFDQKHHCRLCGNGLCSNCSSKSKPVPERGWGETSVRVCDRCYERSDNLTAISSLPPLPLSMQEQRSQAEDSEQQYGKQTDNYTKNGKIEDDGVSDADDIKAVDSYNHNSSLECEPINSSQLQSEFQQLVDCDDDIVDQITEATETLLKVDNNCKRPLQKGRKLTKKMKKKEAAAAAAAASAAVASFATTTKIAVTNSSKSIPIPGKKANGIGGGCSTNTTPTQASSSSAESSSSTNQAHHIDYPNANAPVIERSGFSNSNEFGNADAHQCGIDLLSGSPDAMNNFIGLANRINGENGSMITARKFGEVIQSTLKTVVSSAIDYPLGVIKDSARPDYWIPDSEITNCRLCRTEFNDFVTIHHCRRCGGGFCNECSSKTMRVPERGWGETPVRVCDKCHIAN